jgi:hypothetical protein
VLIKMFCFDLQNNFMSTPAAAHRSGDRLPFLTGSCYGHKNS